MSLLLVELASPLIMASFIVLLMREAEHSGRALRGLLVQMALVAVAAWIAEASCIAWYGFYQYDAEWTVFLGPMPVLVALIWPFVIFSAQKLTRAVFHKGERAAGWVFLIVLYDASLVEPVAVKAGLWSWNEPGLFGVPLVGILGWAIFAFSVLWLLDRLDGRRQLLIVVLAPFLTHLALLASWWGLFRWVGRSPIPNGIAVGLAAVLSLALTAIVAKRRIRAGLDVMLPRMGGALLFFVLVLTRGLDLVPLVAYALTFSLPYLWATRWQIGLSPSARQSVEM